MFDTKGATSLAAEAQSIEDRPALAEGADQPATEEGADPESGTLVGIPVSSSGRYPPDANTFFLIAVCLVSGYTQLMLEVLLREFEIILFLVQ